MGERTIMFTGELASAKLLSLRNGLGKGNVYTGEPVIPRVFSVKFLFATDL